MIISEAIQTSKTVKKIERYFMTIYADYTMKGRNFLVWRMLLAAPGFLRSFSLLNKDIVFIV